MVWRRAGKKVGRTTEREKKQTDKHSNLPSSQTMSPKRKRALIGIVKRWSKTKRERARKKKEYLDINGEIHFVHKGPGKWMELYETKRHNIFQE